MIFSQGRKEKILRKTEKKGCWKMLGRVASQHMDLQNLQKATKLSVKKVDVFFAR